MTDITINSIGSLSVSVLVYVSFLLARGWKQFLERWIAFVLLLHALMMGAGNLLVRAYPLTLYLSPSDFPVRAYYAMMFLAAVIVTTILENSAIRAIRKQSQHS